MQTITCPHCGHTERRIVVNRIVLCTHCGEEVEAK